MLSRSNYYIVYEKYDTNADSCTETNGVHLYIPGSETKINFAAECLFLAL